MTPTKVIEGKKEIKYKLKSSLFHAIVVAAAAARGFFSQRGGEFETHLEIASTRITK